MWPFKKKPERVAYRRLNFVPQPDITSWELAQLLSMSVHLGFSADHDMSARDLAGCIPLGCGRHLEMRETHYEWRGFFFPELVCVGSSPCYAVADPVWHKPKYVPVRSGDENHWMME